MNQLYKKYPWLKITTTIEDYVEPNYYDNLLKPYVFSGKTDLKIFENFLEKNFKKSDKKIRVLELGCGNGRATDVFLKQFKGLKYDLDVVDLSPRMIESAKKRFAGNRNIHYINSDSIKYLKESNKQYDLVFSLWSYSHSVHQILTKHGLSKGKALVKQALNKFILKNMKVDSKFFLIHFDSLSDEQRILIQQWKKVYPIFQKNNIQSPSKLIKDKVLENLHKSKIIFLEEKHYVGNPIKYKSPNKALEIFMNFHMESFFNESRIVNQVINELLNYFKKYQTQKGSILIKPGCFVYTFTKLR